MQKLMAYKKRMICACAAAVVIVVAAILLLTGREETFRSILVYDVMGTAVIERESVGTMDAAENLYLESGDRVSVAADSGMRMKLDDDKYVMAEADTVFSVEAEGTEADSRTKICLEQGAITNEIQNPLSEGSQYETSTPNSVMAVRGTIYRAELYAEKNTDEEQTTKLCCFQGQVGVKPILPDGTYGEEILVPAGNELFIYQDGTVSEVGDIAYESLPRQAVENLLDMVENGQDVTGITAEELTQLTLETEDVSEAAESGNAQTKQSETENEGLSETVETALENDAEKADTQIQNDQADPAKNSAIKPADKKKQEKTPQQKDPAPVPPKKKEPANSPGTGNENTGGGDSGNGQPGSNQDKPDQPDKPDKPDKPEQPSKPKTYTVTFMYQGKVFATQSVKSGETAVTPVLVPDAGGAWDFDFGTKIKANTTVTWKEAD